LAHDFIISALASTAEGLADCPSEATKSDPPLRGRPVRMSKDGPERAPGQGRDADASRVLFAKTRSSRRAPPPTMGYSGHAVALRVGWPTRRLFDSELGMASIPLLELSTVSPELREAARTQGGHIPHFARPDPKPSFEIGYVSPLGSSPAEGPL